MGTDRPRVFTATFGTETNSFSPIPTGLAAFRNTMWWRPGEHPAFATEATGPLWAGRDLAQAGQIDLIEGTCAFAMPGGPVTAEAYRTIRDEILDQLAQALPVDIVAFGLHGAMLSFGEEECEADLLERARAIVGPGVPIGAELDLHAHLSPRLVAAADLLVAFKEYPHTDYVARGHDLLTALSKIRAGEIRPAPALFDCRMVGGGGTGQGAMRTLVDDLIRLEADGTIVSGSIIHGFGPGDTARMGSKVLVYTDGDAPAAARIAAEIGRRFRSIVLALARERGDDQPRMIDAVLHEAAAAPAGTVILTEGYDNPGGGAAGDHMGVARHLIAQGIEHAAVGPIWDPQAVRFCFDAGIGATIDLRVGGKTGPASGDPLDVRGTVIGLAREVTQNLLGALPPLGDVAAVAVGGVVLVMSGLRDQCYGPELFRAVGLDPATLRMIVVKGGQQSRIGWGDLAVAFLALPAPPAPPRHYYRRPRPIWPFESAAESALD